MKKSGNSRAKWGRCFWDRLPQNSRNPSRRRWWLGKRIVRPRGRGRGEKKIEVLKEIECRRKGMLDPSVNRAWGPSKVEVGSKMEMSMVTRGVIKAVGRMTSQGKLQVLTTMEGVENSVVHHWGSRSKTGNDSIFWCSSHRA
jgi:hypothetical protein